jgi:hypothetical protein
VSSTSLFVLAVKIVLLLTGKVVGSADKLTTHPDGGKVVVVVEVVVTPQAPMHLPRYAQLLFVVQIVLPSGVRQRHFSSMVVVVVEVVVVIVVVGGISGL